MAEARTPPPEPAPAGAHRRRRFVMIAVGCIGVIVALALCGAGFRYYRWRRCRRMVARARQLVVAMPDGSLRRDLEGHLQYLAGWVEKGWLHDKRDVFLGALHREARLVLRAAQGKVGAPHLRFGHHVVAAVSKVDGAPLYISVTVPQEWNGSDELPLVLWLHGSGVNNVQSCFPAPCLPGALCMKPLARGTHDYLGVQMTALEECVAEVRRRYPVGPFFVMGHSMGGTGSWFYAQRHPFEVAGISPWAGNGDPKVWEGLWEPPPEPPRSPAGRAAALVAAGRSPLARVEQLAGLPVYIGHGTADEIVPIGHSNAMHARLTELEATVRYDRFDGGGHGDIPAMLSQRLAWLLAHRATTGPSAREVAAVIPPLTFVSNIVGAPPHRVLDPTKEARLTFTADGRIVRQTNVEPWSGDGPSKLTYPGPAGRAFEQPFSIALPGDAPEHLRECAATFGKLWERRCLGTPRVADAARGFAVFDGLGLADGSKTLLALGSPNENPAVRAALAGRDVQVSPGRVRLFGRELRGDDIALAMLVPHATLPRAGTLVVWGSTPASYRQLWTRFGQSVDWEGDRGRWWFDYAVCDHKTCGPETFLAVGFFDHLWHFDAGLVFEGSSQVRDQTPGTHWPAAWASGTDGHVWLSSLPPEAVASRRGPAAFDRSAGVDQGALTIHGRAYARGIGVIPPASVTWKLPSGFATLKTEVGLEHTNYDEKYPERHEAERVQFEVWGDGELLGTSSVLTSTDEPETLCVPIEGVESLTLKAKNTTGLVWHYGPVGWGNAELVQR